MQQPKTNFIVYSIMSNVCWNNPFLCYNDNIFKEKIQSLPH